MRVVFIGHCHAPAMRLVFGRFGRTPIISGLIDVGDLAAKGAAVDFSAAAEYDHAVYFPCDYGDDKHVTALRASLNGAPTRLHVVSPLRFTGHHPGLSQSIWYSWSYRRFYDERAKFDRFEDFADWAMWRAFSRTEALEARDAALDRLRDHENAEGTIGGLTRFVTTHDLYKPLFPYATHPTNQVYAHLGRELARVMDIAEPEGLDTFSEEIHPDAHIPVLPSVARDLGLRFGATHYRLHHVMGERSFTMTEWLKMLYFSAPDTYMLAPGWGGHLRCGGADIEVVRQQAIFARQQGESYITLSAPDALSHAMPAGSEFELLGDVWDKRVLGGFTYEA